MFTALREQYVMWHVMDQFSGTDPTDANIDAQIKIHLPGFKETNTIE